MKSLAEISKYSLFSMLGIAIALTMALKPACAADNAQDTLLVTGRPTEDIARDAQRRPADMLAFAHIKPGQTVIDYIPGKGYFTRLFSNAVGTQGAVYSVVPQFLLDKFKDRPRPPSVSLEPGHSNVHDVVSTDVSLNVPVKADVVWTSQNYHDVHIAGGASAAGRLNKAVFEALKPGGLYIVVDHAAIGPQDDATMARLHRIEREIVVQEVTAAGFVFEGESMALSNPADPHTIPVFDPSIRGKTDQFALRFKRPAT